MFIRRDSNKSNYPCVLTKGTFFGKKLSFMACFLRQLRKNFVTVIFWIIVNYFFKARLLFEGNWGWKWNRSACFAFFVVNLGKFNLEAFAKDYSKKSKNIPKFQYNFLSKSKIFQTFLISKSWRIHDWNGIWRFFSIENFQKKLNYMLKKSCFWGFLQVRIC